MIKIPIDTIYEKIQEKTDLTKEEIDEKIKQKEKQLSGLISTEGAAHIIANELNVKLIDVVSGRLKVKEILAGMRSVETVAKIIQVYEIREFQKEERSGKVGSFLMGDETGSIRGVCWGDQTDVLKDLKPGDIIKLMSGYVRDNNGRLELHLNERSSISVNPEGITVEAVGVVASAVKRKKISEISENDGNVELLGTIVQVFDPRFFEICPECNKRARLKENSFACETHGEVTPKFSYVLNTFLDDGSDNIRVIFFRDQAEKLLSKTSEELTVFKDNPGLFEEEKTRLLGNIIKINGRAVKNQLFDRLEIIANDVDIKPNPEEEIKRAKEELQKTENVER